MSRALARLARTLTHHWKRSLLGALVTVILLGMVAGAAGPAADDWDVPGTESQQAYDLFRDHAPALAGADSTLVFSVDEGKITEPANRAAVEDALASVRAIPNVAEVGDPFASGGAIAPDERLASVDVRYSIEPGDLEKEDGERLEAAARTAERGGVDVAARGIVIDMGQQQEAPVGELVGVAIAILLLTLLFRSGAAMGATLVGALIGVMVGQMLIAALSKPLGLPDFAAVIAMMLGLGAGIDYALLIIARFREQLAAGDSVRDASAKSAATAGASVVAAGLIVMVAIAGLLVVGIPAIGKMGVAAAIGVFAVVISALFVLPAFIGAFAK
ncbi:MAG TPA: MMPL family transporter, partial [Conexibacter sp.]|nr:MMPL family transporter [Conexibacter sp.]